MFFGDAAVSGFKRFKIDSNKAQAANIEKKEGFAPLYRLPLLSFARLMTGILQTAAACSIWDQFE